MGDILPQNRYDDIRYALDPMMDEVGIDDRIIESPMYLGMAERWARSLDSAADTRTGDEQESLYLAIIYRTAGLLSPTVPQAKQINMAGHNATFNYAETAAERTARLLSTAEVQIGTYIDLTPPVSLVAPVFVTTVSGRRA